MDNKLYEIAKYNLKYKRMSIWGSVIGVVIFFSIFPFWISEYPEQIWPWFVLTLDLLIMFGFTYYCNSKIIRKKSDPILEEVVRLEKEGFTVDDVEELELKQIVKRYDDNDLV